MCNTYALTLLILERPYTAPDVIPYFVWAALPLLLRPVVVNLPAIPTEAILAPSQATKDIPITSAV